MKNIYTVKHFVYFICCMHLLLNGCDEKNSVNPSNNTFSNTVTFTGKEYFDAKTGETYLLDYKRRRIFPGDAISPSGRVNSPTAVNAPIAPSVTDWSGEVEVAMWESVSQYGQRTFAACNVDPGWVCIGGGAWTDYGTGGGALLTSTEPASYNGPFTGWRATAKDHGTVNQHTLHVYAIGLRLKNVPVETLKQNLTIRSITSSDASKYTYATSYLDPSYWLIGGGVRFDYIVYPHYQLLTKSGWYQAMNGAEGWIGSSKSCGTEYNGRVVVQAIGIKKSIPGFGELENLRQMEWADGGYNTIAYGYLTGPSGYVLTCPGGGISHGSLDYPRYLWCIYPNPNGRTAEAGNKDHLNTANGGVQVYGVYLRKKI